MPDNARGAYVNDRLSGIRYQLINEQNEHDGLALVMSRESSVANRDGFTIAANLSAQG